MSTDCHKEKPIKADAINLMGRIVYLTGSIDDRSVEQNIRSVFGLAANGGNDPITLVINSHGGSVADTLALHDALMVVACPINTLIVGRAYSAAAVLAAISEPGRRYIMPNATMMIHDLKSGCRGGVNEMRSHVERSSEMQARIEQLILAATRLKRKRMRRMMRKEVVFGAHDAVKCGMVDAIIDDIDEITGKGQG